MILSGRVLQLFNNNKGLFGYTLLTYLDRLLIFSIPLMILYLFEEKTLYNSFEYIYSVATIVIIFLDPGIRIYSFYAFSKTEDRNNFVQKLQAYNGVQYIVYQLIVITIFILAVIFSNSILPILLFISIRSLYYLFISYGIIYFRLIDRPHLIYIFSLIVNGVTILLIFIYFLYHLHISLEILFLSQALLTIVVGGYYAKTLRKDNLRGHWKFIRESVSYSFPVLLTVFIMLGINNYGKIYAQNFLSTDEMYQFSLVQRLTMFIQITHAAAIGYLSKSVYTSKSVVDVQSLKKYSVMIAGSILIIFIMVFPFASFVFQDLPVSYSSLTILMILYTTVWCYGAYFEMVLKKCNLNNYIVYFTIATGITFMIVLYNPILEGTENIAFAMVMSTLVFLLLTLNLFRKKKCFH